MSILIDCRVDKLKSLLMKCMLKFGTLIIADSFLSGSNHFHDGEISLILHLFFLLILRMEKNMNTCHEYVYIFLEFEFTINDISSKFSLLLRLF